MATRTEQLANLIQSNDSLDQNIKEVLLHLIQESDTKNQQITVLEAKVRNLNIKVNELERYQSKDSLIFRNIPIGGKGSLIEDVVAFIRDVMMVDICAAEMKACHALGPISFQQPTSIIVKFIYYDQKERIWSRKRFLKNYFNPINHQPVFIHERLSKYDRDLKEYAETQGLFVTTTNSAPMLHIQHENGKPRPHAMTSRKDVDELKGKATKKSTFGGTRNVNNPMSNRQLAPNLEKHVPVIPSTPISTSLPALKRARSAITPPQLRLDDESVIRELKARKNNEADLLDYVKGLLCETPIAKQSIMEVEEDTFRTEEQAKAE